MLAIWKINIGREVKSIRMDFQGEKSKEKQRGNWSLEFKLGRDIHKITKIHSMKVKCKEKVDIRHFSQVKGKNKRIS